MEFRAPHVPFGASREIGPAGSCGLLDDNAVSDWPGSTLFSPAHCDLTDPRRKHWGDICSAAESLSTESLIPKYER